MDGSEIPRKGYLHSIRRVLSSRSVADYANSQIVVFERKTLNLLSKFGQRGAGPGQFQGIHQLAVDSKNNLYVSEVAPGNRAQKFMFKGLAPTR